MPNGKALTICDAVSPSRSWAREVGLVLGFAGLTAAAAQLTIPLWPVPITGQTFAVLLAGAVLGSRRGALSQLAYLTAGSAGLPTFAGGRSGLPIGPTGGYLIGFIAVAFVVGLLAERGWDRKAWTAACAMAIGNGVLYLFGLPWLALFTGESAGKVLALGLYPFIVGDLLKLALAAGLLPSGWRALNHLGERRS